MTRIVVALALLILAACGQEAPYDLQIRGNPTEVGRSLHVRIAESDGDVLIANESFPVDAELDVVYGDLLAESVVYRVDLFLDRNDDGLCDGSPTDRVWTTELGPVRGTSVVDLDTLEQDATACDRFQ